MMMLVMPEPDSQSTQKKIVLTRRQRFSELMREHHSQLLVFATAIVKDHDSAKDIVQDALVTAWKKFDQYETDRDFGKWMRGIIRNKCKDWFRKHQKDALPDIEVVEMEVDIESWQSANAAGTGVFETVEVCMEKLPENLKGAVDTYYFENRDGTDAAEQLQITPANLRKRLERARALLHDCISRTIEADQTPSNITPRVSHAG